MNFLQLCQKAREKCGISGTGPSTVVSQTGEMLRVVNWVNEAWLDIQNAHTDWQWLRASCSFATVAGQAVYSPSTDILLTDFGVWERDSFRNYDTAVGTNSEIFMGYTDYESWRDAYQFGALRATRTRPYEVSISPAKSICLGPFPSSGYTVIGDYYKVPSEMSADADVPALPAQYHMAIIYRAMMFYGAYEAAPEVYQEGETEFNRYMKRMDADRLPEVMIGGALA